MSLPTQYEIRNTKYPMFHSIRWRLILSYTALTLLTVVLVGALALALLRQYAERRAEQSFRANAEAIAAQARPLLDPPRVRLGDLEQLAVTAAFLGNMRVRIRAADGRLLVDSDAITPAAGADISLRPRPFFIPNPDGGMIFAMPPMNRRGMMGGEMEGVIITDENGATGVITIHRYPGLFGNRLQFDGDDAAALPAGQSREAESRPRHFWELLYGEGERGHALPVSALAVTAPVGDPANPAAFVELSDGPDFVAGSLFSVRRSLLAAGIGAGLLAVLVGLLVSRGLTAPILSLGEAARRMGEGDLSARAPAQSRDEIGQVAAHFNQMAERLQASFAELAAERDALRRFVADASHELRTPITALKSFNELLSGPAAGDPAAQAEFLAESAVQVERLQWITANLLDLSRLDGRLVQLDLAAHDVADLLDEAAAPFRALAGERSIELAVESPQPAISLTCDRARLVLALSNLLDNGLKYCAPGDRVVLGAGADGERVTLWVADSGPGIDPAQQAHIFERFYRGRTRGEDGQEIPGSGLGLSIVASVIQAHGWQVRVESAVGAGTRFVIEAEGGQRTADG